MGYATNPFNSKAGNKILKENFRLVFAASAGDPKDIEAKNVTKITGHFVKHTEQIINNIMKFSKGHRPIVPANAFETGIYVCPHCLRRDFMNLWEFEYLGYYKPGSMANKSLDFQKSRKGKGFHSDTYATLARVKCNTVYSCDSCYATYEKQPNYGCDRCNGKDFNTVGCGAISYAEHFTPSLDVGQLFSNPQQSGVLTVNQNQHYTEANIGPNGQIVKRVLVMPTAFEYSKNAEVRGANTRGRTDYVNQDKDYKKFMQQIPSLNVAYSSKHLMIPNSANCVAKPKVQEFPISPMRIFRWPAPPRFRCTNYQHRKYNQTNTWDKPIIARELGTNYWCTTRDEFGRQHGIRWSKKGKGLDNSMVPTLTSPNPLPFNPNCRDQGGCVCTPNDPPGCVFEPKQYKGGAIYRLTLEMRPRKHMDETYQYSLLLPAKFSLQRFMKNLAEIPINQGTLEFCPNDPVVEEALTKIDCDALNELDEFTPQTNLDRRITVQDLIDDGRTDVVDIITKYANGIVNDELSQISLEGCSERGVLMNSHYRGWVDYSSKVLNAAGDLVPRYLFINRREKDGRDWLAEYCKKLNDDFKKGQYVFMDFSYTNSGSRYRDSRTTRYADHLFSPEFVSKAHDEDQLLPVLAGTSRSISTSSGGEAVFSREFWRKLRGVKLKSTSGKTTFKPIVTNGDTSFLPTHLISNMRLPICTLNGQVTKLVQGAQKKLRATHGVIAGIQFVDQSMMSVYTVMRCETCNGIFDAGGVMNYRSSQGWVNSATGLVTGNPRFYTQKAFDTELTHELAVDPRNNNLWEPFITADGFRACPNWGIDSMQKYGKAMLKGATVVSMDVGMRGSAN